LPSLAERIAGELDALITEGSELLKIIGAKTQYDFVSRYQGWYTRALAVVDQLIPGRLDDFQRQYSTKRKGIADFSSYVLEDYVHGVVVESGYYPTPAFDVHNAAKHKFNTQLKIVAAAKTQLSDVLANIRSLLQADLFSSELDAARYLKNNGHLRAAGAVAGVVLEGHLKELAQKHQVKVAKKRPALADYNQALTAARILDGTDSLWIQRLATIRNLCDHKKTREPRPEEVEELIDGADKAISTLK